MSRSESDLQAQGSLSVTFYESQGYSEVIITRLHTGNVINRPKNIFVRDIPETRIDVLFKTPELELAPHSRSYTAVGTVNTDNLLQNLKLAFSSTFRNLLDLRFSNP
jgi:hypothetical protein